MNVFELMVRLTELIDEGHGQRAVFSEGCDCDGYVAEVVLAGAGKGTDPSDWVLLKRPEDHSLPRSGCAWDGLVDDPEVSTT
jgi:hypothetical protein